MNLPQVRESGREEASASKPGFLSSGHSIEVTVLTGIGKHKFSSPVHLSLFI